MTGCISICFSEETLFHQTVSLFGQLTWKINIINFSNLFWFFSCVAIRGKGQNLSIDGNYEILDIFKILQILFNIRKWIEMLEKTLFLLCFRRPGRWSAGIRYCSSLSQGELPPEAACIRYACLICITQVHLVCMHNIFLKIFTRK